MIKPYLLLCFCSLFFLFSCKEKTKTSAEKTKELLPGLKRGDVIACGPPEKEFGSVNFASSCSPATQKDFNLAVALLHSFEYD
ncbi:MAG: hypothetical protein ABIR30_03385 [Chitinophagaceae bacterium]